MEERKKLLSLKKNSETCMKGFGTYINADQIKIIMWL